MEGTVQRAKYTDQKKKSIPLFKSCQTDRHSVWLFCIYEFDRHGLGLHWGYDV